MGRFYSGEVGMMNNVLSDAYIQGAFVFLNACVCERDFAEIVGVSVYLSEGYIIMDTV